MVKAVARRLLRHEQDAEDVFQATFLALAAAAGRRKWRPTIAAWLHQTAVRSARSLARMNARWRRNVEEKSRQMPEGYTAAVVRDGLRQVLDEELARLPARLRAAIVLCDLEGVSRKEAATQLGVPASTLANHVADGRKRLRARLLRRGVGLSVAGLAANLAEFAKASTPLSPAAIGSTTTKAALFAAGKAAGAVGVSTTVVHLSQGVLRAMTFTKISMMCAAGLAIVLGAGSIGGVTSILSSVAKAETIFFDSFDDGDAMDGSPVRWEFAAPPYSNGTLDATSGDLVVRPNANNGIIAAGVLDKSLSDVSIRAQVRAEGNTNGLDLLARGNVATGTVYEAGIDSTGLIYVGYNPGTGLIDLVQQLTDLRPSQEDVLLQFDVIGDRLSLYAWRDGDAKPIRPQLEVTDSRYAEGAVGIVHAAINSGIGIFRYVHVADASIPEPPTMILSAIFFAGVFAWRWRRSR
jgi:RNA polymerase sigma factor (sigma-70 family)